MIEVAQVVDINPWAVVVAAAAAFLLGAVWYSPKVFGRQWLAMHTAATRIAPKQMKETSPVAYLGTAFAYLVMAYVLAYLMGLLGAVTLIEGLAVSGWIALGFVLTFSLINALFHGTRRKLWALNSAYYVSSLLLMGVILGAWQ